ncbi:MAG: SPFH domain-containing protein [Eubacteriales bacterium]|nr:SPFH domain-containing protein [Eubacteriales bacterium]
MSLIMLLFVIVIVLLANIVIVPQAKAYVVERLGAYYSTWNTGLHFKIPFLDRIARRVSLKEQVIDFAPQPVITKDNVTMQIDSVVYLTYSDPKLLTYGVENPMSAIENLTATTLRNIIGDMELDQTLTSRDTINSKMRIVLDEATDPWGIKITRVELKNIMPPKDIQDSMEKQMRAERERREAILQAEGQKQSQILVAEGVKQSTILQAEAKKEAQILEAEADKISKIKRAEGEADAILKIQSATALGLEKIKNVQFDDGLIRYKSLETLEKMSNGQSTKIIIPSELQGLAGTLASLGETLK